MWEPRDEQTQMLVGRTGCKVKTGAQEVPSVLAKFSPARGLAPFLLVQGWDHSVSHRAKRKWLLGTVKSGMNPAYQAGRFK